MPARFGGCSESKWDTSPKAFSYGVWRILEGIDGDPSEVIRKRIEFCLELGITTFDHADIYGDYECEAAFGKVLKDVPSLKSQIQVVTKAGIKLKSAKFPDRQVKSYDTSYKYLIQAAEKSLQTLSLDVIDLFLIHRPDPYMNLQETGAALNELVSSGKVRAVGVSNFRPDQVTYLNRELSQPLAANQIELSVLAQDPLWDGTLDQCQSLKMLPMVWSPLAGGALFKDDHKPVRSELELIAEKYQCDVATLALAWLMNHPSKPIPIIGSNQRSRIHTLATARNIELERDDWYKILELGAGREVP
ncbi:aldo/keto reductase [Pseudobacteriovorax antillogorgiicola]|uniref:Predicted oxidoreductase n=1 Tax=Pseudobacteriovorax antillogorgiicola TaxID=1513793 RepID=A0A1Y6C0P1_9BACT|nr:aldo/keto reductase [Pseudobacteriovorax antillogorgiicola]TCS52354.1 putative oxidoreductase [Pseudobacteriovorax antillogorgiicola]SMF29542.1 Predicted oxidoreductase [Pseudobacteriovorax antillogorgiicola]